MDGSPRVRDMSDLTIMHLLKALEAELEKRNGRRIMRHTPTPASVKAAHHAYEPDTAAFLAQFSDQEAAYRAAVAMEKRDMQFAAGKRRGHHGRHQ